MTSPGLDTNKWNDVILWKGLLFDVILWLFDVTLGKMNSSTLHVFSGVGIQGIGVAKVSETMTLNFEDDKMNASIRIEHQQKIGYTCNIVASLTL